MTQSNSEKDPLINPEQPGHFLDAVQGMIPVQAQWLDGIRFGDTESRQKGSGIEIDGLRPYEFGDDPRHVDWPATARSVDGELQVRSHYRDITPTAWLVTDSLQMRHRANAGWFSEQQLAVSALCTLMQVAQQQGMPTGVLAMDDETTWVQRPQQGKRHIGRTARHLADMMMMSEQRSKQEIDALSPGLSEGLQRVARELTAESVIIVVSDFRDCDTPLSDNGWESSLRVLQKPGNDLIAVETNNPWDYELPSEASRFELKQGAVHIGYGKRAKRFIDTYLRLAQDRQNQIDASVRRSRAAHLKLSTAQPRWFYDLRRQLDRLARKANQA